MKAAIYARYSTSHQREESIDDQFRVCDRLAVSHGFTVAGRYSDKEISGGTAAREGYQKLLTDARAGRFVAIVAEDVSRLWRNQAEQSARLAELADLGVDVVTIDLDTRQEETALILGAVKGAMSESYRQEIGRRTRRGLEGLAVLNRPTGGRAYGYIAAADAPTKQREIDEVQAEVVRRIFRDYADGLSAATICGALNREGVPSPGASWARTERRAAGWVVSCIAGDPKRGTGILNNEQYVGRTIWNRSRWVRSRQDSSKRRCLPNPRSKWIINIDERLRIVSDELWNRVKRRQADGLARVGERIARGISESKAALTGPRPKHLLSGLLRCGSCESNFVSTGRDAYACSSFVHGRACDNTVRVKRSVIEPLLLDGLKSMLMSPGVIEEARRRAVTAVQRAGRPDATAARRVAALRGEVANLTDAIASGALKASRAIGERLAAAEAELARLEAQQTDTSAETVAKLTPRLVDQLRRAAEDMPALLRGAHPERGRAVISSLVGDITVRSTEAEVIFETKKGAVEGALMRLAGGKHTSVVAGVGFEPTTFGL
jgi:site-specific DNA recombinase